MVKNMSKAIAHLVDVAQQYGAGCKKVYVSVSGGVDSSVVAAILCRAFGPENVVGMYRDIRSNPKHMDDVKLLQEALGFNLVFVDANSAYDNLIAQFKSQFISLGLPWADEGSEESLKNGFDAAFDSLKSRFTTPLAGFISKAIDSGHGRIFGTGNAEEDGLLRYFDKYGDGAVDNNILSGFTKAEVKQLGIALEVPNSIIVKKPSADLRANGDVHNDESQLTEWAHNMGYNISISYGAPDGSCEGNIAWALKEDMKNGVITGSRSIMDREDLDSHGYSEDQILLILFLRRMEFSTRHKVSPIPGISRKILLQFGLVD